MVNLSRKNSKSGMSAVMIALMLSIVMSLLAVIMTKRTISATIISENTDLKEIEWSLRQKLNALLSQPTTWQATLNDSDNRLTTSTITLASCFLTLHPDGYISGTYSSYLGYPVTRTSSGTGTSMQYNSGSCPPQNASYNIAREAAYPGGSYPRFTLRDSRELQVTDKDTIVMMKDDGSVCTDAATDGYTCRWSITSEFYAQTATTPSPTAYPNPDAEGINRNFLSKLVIRFHLKYVKPDSSTGEVVADMWWDTVFSPALFDQPTIQPTGSPTPPAAGTQKAPDKVVEYTIRTQNVNCAAVVPYGTFTVPAGTNVNFRAEPRPYGGGSLTFSWAKGNMTDARPDGYFSWPGIDYTINDDRTMKATCGDPIDCNPFNIQVGDSMASTADATEYNTYKAMIKTLALAAWDNLPAANAWGCGAGDRATIRGNLSTAMDGFPAWKPAGTSRTTATIGTGSTCVPNLVVLRDVAVDFVTLPAGYGPYNKTGVAAQTRGVTFAISIYTTQVAPCQLLSTAPLVASPNSCTSYTFNMGACSDRYPNAVCETDAQLTNGRHLEFRTQGAALNDDGGAAGNTYCLENGVGTVPTQLSISSQRFIRGNRRVTMTPGGTCDCGNLASVQPPAQQAAPDACENGHWTMAADARTVSCTDTTAFRSCTGYDGASYATCETCAAIDAAHPTWTALDGQTRLVERFCPYAAFSQSDLAWASAPDFDSCKTIADTTKTAGSIVNGCVDLIGGKLKCECGTDSGSCRWVSYAGATCP